MPLRRREDPHLFLFFARVSAWILHGKSENSSTKPEKTIINADTIKAVARPPPFPQPAVRTKEISKLSSLWPSVCNMCDAHMCDHDAAAADTGAHVNNLFRHNISINSIKFCWWWWPPAAVSPWFKQLFWSASSCYLCCRHCETSD